MSRGRQRLARSYLSGAMDSTSGTIGGGSDAIPGEAGGSVCSNACNGESGGGTDVAVAAVVPIASSRVRSSATWLMALRAKMKATIAITSAKKSNGKSNIRPPGAHVRPLTGHVRSLVAIQ